MLFVGDDALSSVDLKSFGGGGDQRVGRGSKGHDDRIAVDNELGAGNLYGASSPGSIRLAQLHADTFHAADPVIFILQNFHWIGQEVKNDAFLLRVVNLLHTGGKLFLTSSVYDMYLGAKTQSGSRGVHGHVASADHGDLLSAHDGRIGILAEGLHQVASGQILVGGEYTVGIFTGNPHEFGKSGSGADEHGGEALFVHKLVDGDRFSNDHVGLDLHAQRLHVLDLFFHNGFLGETEFGNAVYQHAAGLVKGLEDGHVIAHLGQISRAGKARGARADHGHLFALLLCGSLRLDPVFSRPIRHEALQLTDGNGFALNSSDAFSLTLALLRANAAADGGQSGGGADHLIGGLHISLLHLFDEAGNVDGYGASLHALRVFAVDASGSLFHRLFFVISQADLLKVGCPFLRILFPDGYLF